MLPQLTTIAWNRAYKRRVTHVAEAGQPNEQEGGTLPGTFLAIPYYAGDRGYPTIDRPLGSKAISWLCPSIVVNGIKGWNTFQRGELTTVTVDVVNSGVGTTAAAVQVTVSWAEPCTVAPKLNPFGSASVPVPTDQVPRTSPPITSVIPVTAPPHICLFARVSSLFDAPVPESAIQPADDRHWAVHNLFAQVSSVGKPFQLLFWAGNPFDRPRNFDIVARAVDPKALPLLGRYLRTDLTPVSGIQLQLADRRGAWTEQGQLGIHHALVLEPQEGRPMTITGVLPEDVEPGQSVALEIVQVAADDRESNQLVGSIGVIVTAQRRS
jgi:hypothetical protein